MRAALGHPARFDHVDHVGAPHRAQPVGDDEAGTTLQELAQGFLDQQLGARVDVGGGLVQHQDARILEQGAGDRQELTLAAAQVGGTLLQHGVVAVGKLLDELVSARPPRRRFDVGIRGVRPAVTDVVADGVREQKGVLQHDADALPEAVLGHAADVLPVDGHGAGLHVVEALQQADDGGLAGTGRAHQRHGLAGLGDQVDALQHRRAGLVGEGHAGQLHAAFGERQRPGVGGVFDLRHLVQQLEDALGAGDGRLHLRPQHRDGPHRLEEAAHVLQEGDDHADADQLQPGQKAPVGEYHRDTDGADDVHRRGERRGQRFRADVGIAVGAVELAEALRVPTLAVERLRHARA